MTCPVCGNRTRVIANRAECDGVYRLRVCTDPTCKHRFFTSEYESDGESFYRIQRQLDEERRKRRKA